MKTEPLVVATLNLLDDLRFWEERRALVLEGLRELAPHLIALQEVSLEAQNARWLARELGGYEVAMCPRSPHPKSDSLAILSGLAIRQHETFSLIQQGRAAHRVNVEHQGVRWTVANTHLHWHPMSEAVRVSQAERLLQWLPSDRPTVLCGDLNAFPHSATVKLLSSRLSSAYAAVHGAEPLYTYPTLLRRGSGLRHSARDLVLRANGLLRTRQNIRHGGTIDYIFVNPRVRVEECNIVLDRPAPDDGRLFASDHVGLLARLRPHAAPAGPEDHADTNGLRTRLEPGQGQESVWDYPRPPRVEATSRRIRVVLNGKLVADSVRALRVLETSHPPVYYVPLQDVDIHSLEPSRRKTICEFKGTARYYSVVVGGRRADDAAWYYPDPLAGYEALRRHVAFYPGRMDACYVDEEAVTAQPGDFYGGWITSDIVGPFKGGAGTRGW